MKGIGLTLLALVFITACQQNNHNQSKISFKEILLDQLLIEDLETLKLSLPKERAKTIHQGNLTHEEDQKLKKIASLHSEEEIKRKTSNVLTKQDYLSLWH